MLQVHEGQCGMCAHFMCAHFGEHHSQNPDLVQIRMTQKAPEDMVDECDHPNNALLHLKVTPISGCDGFEPVRPN